MGKDLKNKEIGTGLSQRKDGKYSARFVTKSGSRKEKYFNTLPQARNWLADARYEDAHSTVMVSFDKAADQILNDEEPQTVMSDMTVDEWFDFWMENIVSDLSYNTLRNYRDRYMTNARPVIGRMKMRDVKPFHCKKILMDMEKKYAGSTIRQTYIAVGTMFKSARENGVISKHPFDGLRYTIKTRETSDIKYLTLDEQEKFLETAKRSHNYDQYRLILETGLRTGEMVGLTWDAIDFDNRTLTVEKTLEYRHSRGYWLAGAPKTIASYRTIPLTDCAYGILKSLYDGKDHRKESPHLEQVLDYRDRRTGMVGQLNMKDLVFVNFRTGLPNKNSSYDTHLYKLSDEAGIKRFCMHALRHTYATRAIERGVNPKALQMLLGHKSLQVTMDTYVHVTDDSKLMAVRQFEGKIFIAQGKGETT